MSKTLLRSSVFSSIALMLIAGCSSTTTTPTAPPGFDATRAATFVNGNDGSRTALTLIDYKSRTLATAVTFDNLLVSPTPLDPADPVQPDTAPSVFGAIAFAFDQLLMGATVETTTNQQTTGATPTDIAIGQRDWSGKFKIITGFTPNPNVIAYVDSTTPGTQPVADNSLAFPTYQPSGAWNLDPAAKIWEYPPPAIVVFPTNPDGVFPIGQTVIIHLLAGQVQGSSGLDLPPATNATGDVITVQLAGGGAPVPVAASVVVFFPTP